MTLSQMRYFQAVCQYENYTKAAAALFVSQPAVSQAIREIETECGVQLLIRKGNTLQVTDAGRVLLDEVDAVLRHVDALNNVIASDALKRNYIRIGLSTFSSSSFFPRICAEYHRTFPDVRILSHEDTTPALFKLLDADRADAIITAPDSHMPAEELNQRYHLFDLGDSGLRYFVSRKHRWAGRESITMQEIAEEPLIILGDKYPSGKATIRRFNDMGLTPNVLMETSQMFTIERFVESGAAGGFLPAQSAESNPNIVMIPCEGDQPLRRTSLVWKREKNQHQTVADFIRLVKRIGKDN